MASDDRAKLGAEAQQLNSAASRANSARPPGCADPHSNYRLGMSDWMTGAIDAAWGNFKSTSSSIAKGSREVALVTVLKSAVQGIAVPVVVKATTHAPATPATPPAPVTAAAPVAAPTTPAAAPAPAPTTPAAAAPAPTTPSTCYPISDEGTCYEPGEYCRDDDHGTSGVAGDGEAITCEDNDGWRWEPS